MKLFSFVQLRRLTCLAAVGFAGLNLNLDSALAAGEALSADLFVDDGVAAVPQPSGAVLKQHAVRINQDVLKAATHPGALLKFNLFVGTGYTGVVETVETQGETGLTLVGHLQGKEASSFALVANKDVVVMNLRPDSQGLTQVRYLGNGLHLVQQLDENLFPPCEKAPTPPMRTSAAAASVQTIQTQGAPAGDAGDVIDVMVVYTPSARIAAGGTNAIQAMISLAFLESNTAYQQSLVNPRIRLVYQAEIAYTETPTVNGGYSTDLDHLTNPSDGFMDEVLGLRNACGADLVSLWINNSDSCGIGWLMTSLSPAFETDGYSVVHYGCATGNYSFAHELGHNMGCQHDRENSIALGDSQGLYPYSFGWRFNGTNSAQFRTIMAYDPGTRIQRFSNPNVSYMGTPTGVPVGDPNESNNALTINNSASTVSNFRQTIGGMLSTDVGDAVDAPALYWVTGGDTNWFLQTNTTHDGIDAAQSGAIADFQSTWVQTTVVGPGLLTFWWKVSSEDIYDTLALFTNGVAVPNGSISGEVDWQFRSVPVSGGSTTVRWQYSKDFIGAVGQDRGWLDQVSFTPLADAVDNPGLTWIVSGDAWWTPETTTTHDGVDAAVSGAISDSQISRMSAVVNGPATLKFWWKVSSEATFDFLRFFTNGVQVFAITGEQDWQQRTVNLAPGSQLLAWRYDKDEIDSGGQDKGWVDQVVVTAPSRVVSNSFVGGVSPQFSLQYTGLVGGSYTIQASTNLQNWVNLTNIVNTTATIPFVEKNLTNYNYRFYRIISP